MNWLSTVILGSLSVAGGNSQIVVTERIGYCGVLPSSFSVPSVSSSLGSFPGSIINPTSTSFPTTTSAAFLVGFQPSNPIAPQLRRRQALQNYITPDGKLTSDCSASPILAVTPEGELSAADGEIYSTSQGTESGPFIASSNPGNISTIWQLSDGTLRFNNASFLNGAASICADGGSIEAYYLIEPPPTCSPGVLTTIALSVCPSIASSTAGSSNFLSPSPVPTSSNSAANPINSLNSTSYISSAAQTYFTANASSQTNITLTPRRPLASAPTKPGSAGSNGPTSTGAIISPFGNLSTSATPIQQISSILVR